MFAIRMMALFTVGMLIVSGAVFAAPRDSFEHVPESRLAHLNSEFSTATPLAETSSLLNSKIQWSCEMVGARSRSFVERGLNLYRFEFDSKHKNFKNTGSHLIKSYQLKNREFMGAHGNLVETIRMSKTNALIAELSVETSGDNPKSSRLLAYTVCTAL